MEGIAGGVEIAARCCIRPDIPAARRSQRLADAQPFMRSPGIFIVLLRRREAYRGLGQSPRWTKLLNDPVIVLHSGRVLAA